MTIYCPTCGATEFEKRGEQRIYLTLGPDLEEGSWDGGETEIDCNDNGKETIYCIYCDSEWDEGQLREIDNREPTDVEMFGAGSA